MKLLEFIEKYIANNSIIRLLYKNNDGSYNAVTESFRYVDMEWKIKHNQVIYKNYINNKVIFIINLMVDSFKKHPDAINIVIEKKSNVWYKIHEIIYKYNINYDLSGDISIIIDDLENCYLNNKNSSNKILYNAIYNNISFLNVENISIVDLTSELYNFFINLDDNI